MQTILNTPDDPAHDSLVEKKSEFIGDAAHVDTLERRSRSWLRSVSSIRSPTRGVCRRGAEARMGDCPNA